MVPEDDGQGKISDVADESIHGALSAAFDEAEKAQENEPEGVDGEVGPEDKGAAGEDKGEDKSQSKQDEKPLSAKDVSGKVVAREKAEKDDIDIKMPKSRAPGSWTPVAREKWAALPTEIQREVLKRERDIANGFNEVAEIKKFRDVYGGIMNQHQGIINAEGGDGMKMTRDLFQTAATLYNGSPDQKVRTVAAMIRNFGIDLQMLDEHLSQTMGNGGNGAAPPQRSQYAGGGPDIASLVRQQVDAALAPYANQRQEALTREVDDDIANFASDPANEFFDDVKDTMADLLDVATKQHKTLSLQDAYKRATLMHSEIADVITDRQLREKASSRNEAAAKAKRRAVSVTGAPATDLATGVQRGDSLRADLEAAIEANSE
jgi:hypothetical protein